MAEILPIRRKILSPKSINAWELTKILITNIKFFTDAKIYLPINPSQRNSVLSEVVSNVTFTTEEAKSYLRVGLKKFASGEPSKWFPITTFCVEPGLNRRSIIQTRIVDVLDVEIRHVTFRSNMPFWYWLTSHDVRYSGPLVLENLVLLLTVLMYSSAMRNSRKYNNLHYTRNPIQLTSIYITFKFTSKTTGNNMIMYFWGRK